MEAAKEQIFRTYAWAYFSFHADQRMKTFNFFLIVAGLLSGGIVTLMRDNVIPWLTCLLGFALSVLCFLFWRLDKRNKVLVRNGEAAIKFLDSQHELPNLEGTPHVLCIFERDDHNQQGQPRSVFKADYLSYSQVITSVYGVFAFLGIFFGLTPFLLTKQPAEPLAVQLQNGIVTASQLPVQSIQPPIQQTSNVLTTNITSKP